MLRRMRPAEAASTLVGLAAMSVAVWTWTDARPWPADGPTRSAAAPSARTAASPVPTPPDGAGSQADGASGGAGGSSGAAGQQAGSADGAGAGASGGSAVSGAGAASGVSFGGAATGVGAGSRPSGGRGVAAAAGGQGSVAGVAGGGARTGRACLLLAPSGAQGAGHNGWAFRLPDGRWLAGATENNQPNEVLGLVDDANTDGALWADEGDRTDTWSRTVGGFDAVRLVFASRLDVGGHWMHDAGYYTQARCGDVPAPDVAAARAAVDRAAGSGYGVLTDNCLTKAVDILDAYGADLPDAFLEEPNEYISTTATGFGALTAL